MATIQDYLDQISSAVYGKDVRSAIYNAILQCYKDGSAVSDAVSDVIESKVASVIQEMIDDGTLAALEVETDDTLSISGAAADAAVTGAAIKEVKELAESAQLEDGSITSEKLATDVMSDLLGKQLLTAEYSTAQKGYKFDGTRVGWSNVYSTEKLDCTNIRYIICEDVGAYLYSSSYIFPSFVFFDSDDNVISCIYNETVIDGTSFSSYTGTIIVPDDAVTVGINKIVATAYESANAIYYVARSIGEEISEVQDISNHVHNKRNAEVFTITDRKKIMDCEKSSATLTVTGDSAEIYVTGMNSLPRIPDQVLTSNGITFTFENGRIFVEGTPTSTSASVSPPLSTTYKYVAHDYYARYDCSPEQSFGADIAVVGETIYGDLSKNLKDEPKTCTSDKESSTAYVALRNMETGTEIERTELFFDAHTEYVLNKHTIPSEYTVIKYDGAEQSYDIDIEKGSEIIIISDGETEATLEYSKDVMAYQEISNGGIIDRPEVNPDWWGWNLEDGDAFFRYNCDTSAWPAYKEVDGPVLIRGQLVVGKNKRKLGGTSYNDSVPARYGFHIFEGVGNEDDGKRLTMVGGKFNDSAGIFYFQTPYDGDDSNLDADGRSYGWLQLGSDNYHKGLWITEDASRMFEPLTLVGMTSTIEDNSDTIDVPNGTYGNVEEQDLYPVGTMYYSTTHGTVRVKTSDGWKSVTLS